MAALAQAASAAPGRTLRCVEFYSGIGGWAAAAAQRSDLEVVRAFDMNQNANAAYARNWSHAPSPRGIEHLTAAELDGLAADAWFLSPPCQPFTRAGLQRDAHFFKKLAFGCLTGRFSGANVAPCGRIQAAQVRVSGSRTRLQQHVF